MIIFQHYASALDFSSSWLAGFGWSMTKEPIQINKEDRYETPSFRVLRKTHNLDEFRRTGLSDLSWQACGDDLPS